MAASRPPGQSWASNRRIRT